MAKGLGPSARMQTDHKLAETLVYSCGMLCLIVRGCRSHTVETGCWLGFQRACCELQKTLAAGSGVAELYSSQYTLLGALTRNVLHSYADGLCALVVTLDCIASLPGVWC